MRRSQWNFKYFNSIFSWYYASLFILLQDLKRISKTLTCFRLVQISYTSEMIAVGFIVFSSMYRILFFFRSLKIIIISFLHFIFYSYLIFFVIYCKNSKLAAWNRKTNTTPLIMVFVIQVSLYATAIFSILLISFFNVNVMQDASDLRSLSIPYIIICEFLRYHRER